jgi:hypothetical protein
MTCEELSRILLQMANAPSGSRIDLHIQHTLNSSDTVVVYAARFREGQVPVTTGASLADGGIAVNRVQLRNREGHVVVDCEISPSMQRTIAILLDMLRTRGDIPVRLADSAPANNGEGNQISVENLE